MKKVMLTVATAGLLTFGAGTAYADGVIYLSDLNGRFDSLPVCEVEDCSDQPFQIGWWLDRDTGNWYLSTGEESHLVIDDTARYPH